MSSNFLKPFSKINTQSSDESSDERGIVSSDDFKTCFCQDDSEIKILFKYEKDTVQVSTVI